MPVASTPLTAPGITPPGDYALPPDRYHALLAERATCVRPDLREDEGKVGHRGSGGPPSAPHGARGGANSTGSAGRRASYRHWYKCGRLVRNPGCPAGDESVYRSL